MANSGDSGMRLLADPLTNQGTAFTEAERSELGLRGLLPSAVEPLDQQVARSYQEYQQQRDDLARHINLRALQDTNETLFYRLILDHVEEMLPIIYTPTVGLACHQPGAAPPRAARGPGAGRRGRGTGQLRRGGRGGAAHCAHRAVHRDRGVHRGHRPVDGRAH